MTELRRQIVDLMQSIEIVDAEQGVEAFTAAMNERFPHATYEDIRGALVLLEDEQCRRSEEHQTIITAAAWKCALFRKYKIPESMQFGEAIATIATMGDPEAITYLSHFHDPKRIAQLVMFGAAADQHPNWEHVGLGNYLCIDPEDPQGTIESLLDWYRTTFPAEARLIEDEVCRGIGHA